MTMPEAIRTWLMGCEELASANLFGVDYRGDRAAEYTLFSVPSPVNRRTDICGNVIYAPRQKRTFYFDATLHWSDSAPANIANLLFSQTVADWIANKSAARELPACDEGTITSIMPTACPYMLDGNTSTARYRVSLEVAYDL